MGSEFMFGSKREPTMCYKASAAAAEYSRQVAMEYYGCGRPYGYVYGGSGGDPCKHTTENEAFMYREMLRMGLPPILFHS